MHAVHCGFGVNCVVVGSILLHTVSLESLFQFNLMQDIPMCY